MKIIFLNCWNGKIREPFFDFIKNNSNDTDIFCLQEVNKNLHKELLNVLPNFMGIESHKLVGPHKNYEISIFISKLHKVLDSEVNIIKNNEIGDCVTVQFSNFVLCGVHGVAQPGNKLDTEGRIVQSQEILNSVKSLRLPTIIGGDFNLDNQTKSIGIFSKNGYKDLINEYKIEKTRNKIAWEYHKANNFGFYERQLWSDYCFVSKDVKVQSFEVPDIGISDHLPLILDFEI